jgi:hypothetical protein
MNGSQDGVFRAFPLQGIYQLITLEEISGIGILYGVVAAQIKP